MENDQLRSRRRDPLSSQRVTFQPTTTNARSSNGANLISEFKLKILLKLVKELLFYLVVYSGMTLFVNLSLIYLVFKKNWRLFKQSFNRSVALVYDSVVCYRRFLQLYLHNLTTILYSTDLNELEHLKFTLTNSPDLSDSNDHASDLSDSKDSDTTSSDGSTNPIDLIGSFDFKGSTQLDNQTDLKNSTISTNSTGVDNCTNLKDSNNPIDLIDSTDLKASNDLTGSTDSKSTTDLTGLNDIKSSTDLIDPTGLIDPTDLIGSDRNQIDLKVSNNPIDLIGSISLKAPNDLTGPNDINASTDSKSPTDLTGYTDSKSITDLTSSDLKQVDLKDFNSQTDLKNSTISTDISTQI